MSILSPAPPAVRGLAALAALANPRARSLPAPRELAEHLTVLGCLLWWGLPFAHAGGGTNPRAELFMAAALLPAILLTRPWRRVSTTVVVLAAAISLGAVLVCAGSATGWTNADVAAGYALSCGLALVALAWINHPDDPDDPAFSGGWLPGPSRRVVLVSVLLLIGLEQVVRALLPWWGGGDPAAALTGTYGWRNPFAAALLAPALLGQAAAMNSQRVLRILGWAVAPAAVAGIVLSTSRATMVVLGVGWALLGVVLLLPAPGRLRRAGSLVLVSAAACAVTAVLPGPPLFEHRSSPLAATEQRAATGETIGSNTTYRTQFWRESLDAFSRHPVAGTGFRGLGLDAREHAPGGWALSPQAHNGWLQAFSDGGLVLGLPFLAGMVLLLGALLIRARRHLRDPGASFTLAAAVTVAALYAHASVDFDWSRPALLAVPGLLAAVAGLGAKAATTRRPAPVGSVLVGWVLVGCVLIVPAAAAGTALTRVGADAALRHASGLSGQPRTEALVAASDRAFAGDRAARELVRIALPEPLVSRLQVSGGVARLIVERTADAARIDLPLAIDRARIQVLLGDRDAGQALWSRARVALARRASTAASLAPLAALTGHADELLPVVLTAWRDAYRQGAVPALIPQALAVAALLEPSALSDPVRAGCVLQLTGQIIHLPVTTVVPLPPPGVDCRAILGVPA